MSEQSDRLADALHTAITRYVFAVRHELDISTADRNLHATLREVMRCTNYVARELESKDCPAHQAPGSPEEEESNHRQP